MTIRSGRLFDRSVSGDAGHSSSSPKLPAFPAMSSAGSSAAAPRPWRWERFGPSQQHSTRASRWRFSGRAAICRHSALHEAAARMFDALDGWVVEPEVSFSIYGERGVIDLLAWHPGRRALLVIELKTELVDINDLMGSVDRKRRLAERIARDRGWAADTVSCWVVVADVRTNRRALARHVTTLRAKFPADGRTMRGWLRDPVARIDALGFVSFGRPRTLTNGLAPIRRVRPRRPAARPRGRV